MNEEVVFWKWISAETLGIVTDTAVLHWDLAGEGAPVKVCSFPLFFYLDSWQSNKLDPLLLN